MVRVGTVCMLERGKLINSFVLHRDHWMINIKSGSLFGGTVPHIYDALTSM